VRPFVTVHTFCASRVWSEIFKFNLLTNTKVFLRGLCVVEKGDLSEGYQNPERKLSVNTHFSEIVDLKFGKKLPYILCI